MAKVKIKTLNFPASTSPDVTGYKLYISDTADDLNYDSESFDLNSSTSIDLGSVIGSRDGYFNLGISAVDTSGNESDMSIVDNVPLDFTPPDPPGSITVS